VFESFTEFLSTIGGNTIATKAIKIMMNYKSPLQTEFSTSTIEELLLVYLHHNLYNGESRDLILGWGGAIAIKNANEEKPSRFSEVLVVQKIKKKNNDQDYLGGAPPPAPSWPRHCTDIPQFERLKITINNSYNKIYSYLNYFKEHEFYLRY
jgi:hypothetical protein